MTLATIVLAAATVGARHVSKLNEKPLLAKSFEADPDDWSDDNSSDCSGIAFQLDDGTVKPTPPGRHE